MRPLKHHAGGGQPVDIRREPGDWIPVRVDGGEIHVVRGEDEYIEGVWRGAGRLGWCGLGCSEAKTSEGRKQGGGREGA
jgi:hypothetical protein